jgi:hypothetical protein
MRTDLRSFALHVPLARAALRAAVGLVPPLVAAGCGGGPVSAECASPDRLCVAPERVVLDPGGSEQLRVTAASGDRVVTAGFWSSFGTATRDVPIVVDPAGRVTALEAGEARITVLATMDGNRAVAKDVPVLVRGIRGVRDTVRVFTYVGGPGEFTTYRLGPRDVVGTTPGDQGVQWTSSDTAVFTVAADGVVTGRRAGSARVIGRSISNPAIQSAAPVLVSHCVGYTSRNPCTQPAASP